MRALTFEFAAYITDSNAISKRTKADSGATVVGTSLTCPEYCVGGEY